MNGKSLGTRLRRWLLPLVATGLTASGAQAAVQTYHFVSDQVNGPGVAIGSFSYDTSQPDLDPLPDIGRYKASFEVNIYEGPQDGGFQSTNDAEIQIGGGTGFVIFPPSVDELGHFFQVLDGSLANELPELLDTSLPSESVFLNSALGLPPGADFDLFVQYSTTALVLRDPPTAPVPLPAGLPLLLAGLGGLAWLKTKARFGVQHIPA